MLPPGWTPGPPPVPQPAAQLPPGAGLHPLDVNRAIGAMFSLVRFRWRAMFGVALLLLGPAYAMLALFNATYGTRIAEWSLAWQLQLMQPGGDLAGLPPFPLDALLLSLALGLLASLAGVVATAALVIIVARTYGGADISVGGSIRSAAARWASLAGSYLLLMLGILAIGMAGATVAVSLIVLNATPSGVQPGLAVLLGLVVMVATIVAVVFVALRWSLLVQAIMLDGAGAIDALGRSWRIVAGSTWRVLGYLLLLAFGGFIVGMLVSVTAIVAGMDPLGMSLRIDPAALAAQVLIGGVAAVLVLPFAVTLLTLLYLDLRWRRGEPLPTTDRPA